MNHGPAPSLSLLPLPPLSLFPAPGSLLPPMPSPSSLRSRSLLGLLALLGGALSLSSQAQEKTAPHLKDEMRTPWTRSQERFIRRWQVLGEIPLTASAPFEQDALAAKGGEAALQPDDKAAVEFSPGLALHWRAVTAWGDAVDVSDGTGLKRDLAAYAYTTVTRSAAGKARLCLGSDEGIRAWVNGALVLDRRGPRPLTFDEDQVEVDLKAGANALLVKLEQRTGSWAFAARVLESGATPSRIQEIGPSFTVESPAALVVRTDINRDHAAEDRVAVQVISAGGKVRAEKSAPRGDSIRFDQSAWPTGAYEIRCTTHRLDGLLTAAHLAWYKGDALVAARELVAAGAKADPATPAGTTIKMLADMILDRLGKDGLSVTGNPWWAIHSPLLEYEELKLEAAGQKSVRDRSYGFMRLAWHDEIDGSPQFARAYLPGGYDRTKKWPLVLNLHGYNPPNPVYVRWWGVDSRHSAADIEYANHEGIIYIEPHGRGNTQYLGLGDRDVVRAIELARQQFSVDDERIYLTGGSMGGWGVWNVGTRHPGLFAALAPFFGGVDYHSYLTEAQLAALDPVSRFVHEKTSSWAQADGLLNLPIFVHHGDVDQSVNVDWSRYGVRLLERWGYDIRYMEMPGYGHEELNESENLYTWFLTHRRVAQPRHVRLRSAELQNASAHWVAVDAFDRPDRFMLVDATVTGANAISVDSENILALTLTPDAALVDPARPVTVVWNGVVQATAVHDGRITLQASGYRPAVLAKNARVAGPIGDIFNTPFAIVTGTASADPAMNAACQQKADALVAFWQDWQRQPPRHFKDSEITDADAARYSLVLIGGPDANLVARKLAGKLPLEVAGDRISIGGRSFAVTDARVQMIYPNPLNAQRYVLVVAASSVAALNLWAPGSSQGAEMDFKIEDGHVADAGQSLSPTDLWVAGGWFGRDWSRDDELVLPGKTDLRAKSLVLRGPLEPKQLEAYLGNFQIAPGVVAKQTRAGSRLMAQVNDQPAVELIPAGDGKFYIAEGPATVVFEMDATGRAVAFKTTQNGREFSGKRIE